MLEDLIRREVLRRGYQPVYTPARRARAAARDLRPPRALQREPLRRDGAGRAALPRQADELPDAHRDLPVADALVPRAADSLLRARDRLPLRALGRAAWPPARARVHPGRRSPVRPRGSDPGRDARLLSVRARHPRPVRVQGRQAVPLDPPGELHGRAGACGIRPRPPSAACSRRPAGRSRSTRGVGRSTARRSTSRSAMPSAANGSAAPSSSTSSSPSVSSWSTSPRTDRASGRS